MDLFAQRQAANTKTAMSELLEQAKGVHPDVLSMLFKDRAKRWGLVSGTKSKDHSPYATLIARAAGDG